MSQVWRGFTPDTHRAQRSAGVTTGPGKTPGQKHSRLRETQAAKGGCPRTVPLGQSCATVARSLAHASTDDTAERHHIRNIYTEAQLLRHRPVRGWGCPKTDQGHAAARTHGQTAQRQRTLAVGPRGCPRTDQGHAASRTHGQTANRRRSGHSEAKLRRRPSIQVGCQELGPRAAELVHKGGRVDGVLLHDAHKLRVET